MVFWNAEWKMIQDNVESIEEARRHAIERVRAESPRTVILCSRNEARAGMPVIWFKNAIDRTWATALRAPMRVSGGNIVLDIGDGIDLGKLTSELSEYFACDAVGGDGSKAYYRNQKRTFEVGQRVWLNCVLGWRRGRVARTNGIVARTQNSSGIVSRYLVRVDAKYQNVQTDAVTYRRAAGVFGACEEECVLDEEDIICAEHEFECTDDEEE